MDKMREEFEAWCKLELGFAPEWSSEYDCYSFVGTNDMWLSWKASRAALSVELPQPELGDGAMIWSVDVEVALGNAGVSYK